MARRKQPQEVESDVVDEDVKESEDSEAEHSDDESDTNSNEEETDIESQETKKESPHASGMGTWAPLAILALLFLAFIFLFFVAFSAPLIHPIYLFSLDVTVDAKIDKASGNVQFGVWGYCSSAITNTVGVGPFKHTSSSGGGCSPAHLGWNFDEVPGPFSSVTKAISRFATGLFIFHLLAWMLLIPAIGICVLALLKPDIFNKKSSKSEKPELEEEEESKEDDNVEKSDDDTQNSATARKHKSVTGFVAGLCAFLVFFIFLIDIIVLGTTSHNVKKLSSGAAALRFGNAFYLVLAAMLFLWLAFFVAILDLTNRIGKDAEKDKDDTEPDNENDGEIEVTDKRNDEDERSEAGSENNEKEASSDSDYGDDMHEVDLTDKE